MNYPRQIREKVITHLFDKHGVDYVYHGGELNFKCPICGDSKRDESKMRGWYNLDKDVYWCFNCQEASNFEQLMMIYTNKEDMQAFIIDFLKGNEKLFTELVHTSGVPPREQKREEKLQKITYNNFLLNSCVLISHAIPVPDYVTKWMSDNKLKDTGYPFYYCKDKETRFYDRTIIPFFDRDGDCVYFQARTMSDDPRKYINPVGDKTVLFGESNVDLFKPIPMLEGPLKSLFVENAMSCMSSGLSKYQVKKLEDMGIKGRVIVMFDNDKAGIDGALKMTHKGFRVFVYPDSWPVGLDPDEYCIRKGIRQISLDFVLKHSYDDVAAITLLTLKKEDL